MTAGNVAAVMMMESVTRRARVRGALLGLACGDALGAPFEGRPSVRAADVAAWAAAAGPLRVTDDTVLALALAEHLADRSGQVDQDALALAFARAWLADPGRGYGGAVQHLFARVIEGTWWREASGSQFGGAGSWGNGAAMRVAPTGVAADGLDRVADLARRSAAVTHAHPLGQDGAAVQACAVALAAASTPGTQVDRRRGASGSPQRPPPPPTRPRCGGWPNWPRPRPPPPWRLPSATGWRRSRRSRPRSPRSWPTRTSPAMRSSSRSWLAGTPTRSRQ
jgi:ADP-ribosylglycohydrolase